MISLYKPLFGSSEVVLPLDVPSIALRGNEYICARLGPYL